jgi:hypothetical protein
MIGAAVSGILVGLLTGGGLTLHRYGRRLKSRISDLEHALVVKSALLGDGRRPIGPGRYDLVAGDQLKIVITQQIGRKTFSTDVHIDMHTSARMTVTY